MTTRTAQIWAAVPRSADELLGVTAIACRAGVAESLVRACVAQWTVEGLATCVAEGGRGRYRKTPQGDARDVVRINANRRPPRARPGVRRVYHGPR